MISIAVGESLAPNAPMMILQQIFFGTSHLHCLVTFIPVINKQTNKKSKLSHYLRWSHSYIIAHLKHLGNRKRKKTLGQNQHISSEDFRVSAHQTFTSGDSEGMNLKNECRQGRRMLQEKEGCLERS